MLRWNHERLEKFHFRQVSTLADVVALTVLHLLCQYNEIFHLRKDSVRTSSVFTDFAIPDLKILFKQLFNKWHSMETSLLEENKENKQKNN